MSEYFVFLLIIAVFLTLIEAMLFLHEEERDRAKTNRFIDEVFKETRRDKWLKRIKIVDNPEDYPEICAYFMQNGWCLLDRPDLECPCDCFIGENEGCVEWLRKYIEE